MNKKLNLAFTSMALIIASGAFANQTQPSDNRAADIEGASQNGCQVGDEVRIGAGDSPYIYSISQIVAAGTAANLVPVQDPFQRRPQSMPLGELYQVGSTTGTDCSPTVQIQN